MKNVMLRATRTFIEDLCAPEYAHNHLAVEISHPDGFTDAQELSIRVYSCEYRLLGCDTRSLKGKKSRKVRFDILSEEEWEAGLYRIYVYRNGRPVGWTLLELYSGYECWDKTEVEDFQTQPEEKYFAESGMTTEAVGRIFAHRLAVGSAACFTLFSMLFERCLLVLFLHLLLHYLQRFPLYLVFLHLLVLYIPSLLLVLLHVHHHQHISYHPYLL